jgi:hypothetical protein
MRTHLTLLVSLTLAPALFAQQVAIAPNAPQVLAENGWQILMGQEIVPGTEKFRAQFFTRTYYCGKIGAGKARIVFEEQGASTHLHPLGISPDGTMVASVYSNKLLFVGPDDLPGKIGDGTAIVLPDQKAKTETAIIHANAAGLVVHPAELNKPVPVYFVPLDGRKPLSEKAVELCLRDANSMYRTRTGFQVSDKWIVWDSGSFEVATGKIRKRVAESGVVTDLAIDGDLTVTKRSALVEKKGVCELVAIDLKTGAPKVRYPIASDARFLTNRDGVAYVLTPLRPEIGAIDRRAELVAYDLRKQAEPLSQSKVAKLPEVYATVQFTPKGFTIQGLSAEWVKR